MGAKIKGLFRTDIYELPITAIREMKLLQKLFII